MVVDSQKPKQWVGVASGPSCRSITSRVPSHVLVLLLKGPTLLPCLLCLALVSLCLTLSAQPCPALNTSTKSSTATIRTLAKPY